MVHASKTPRITQCKNLQKDMLTKDPNFDVFSDTSGQVSETYHFNWSQIYSIFYNNDLSDFQDDHPIYERISDFGIHMIAARPVVLPYNDAVRWIIDHAKPKYCSFNNSTRLLLTNCCSLSLLTFLFLPVGLLIALLRGLCKNICTLGEGEAFAASTVDCLTDNW